MRFWLPVLFVAMLLSACATSRQVPPTTANQPKETVTEPYSAQESTVPQRPAKVHPVRGPEVAGLQEMPQWQYWFRITDDTEREGRGFARVGVKGRSITLEKARRQGEVTSREYSRIELEADGTMTRSVCARSGALVSTFVRSAKGPVLSVRDKDGELTTVKREAPTNSVNQLMFLACVGLKRETGATWTRRLLDESDGFADKGEVAAICCEQTAIEAYGYTHKCWRVEIVGPDGAGLDETVWISGLLGVLQYKKGTDKWVRCESPSPDPFLSASGIEPSLGNGYFAGFQVTLKDTTYSAATEFWTNPQSRNKWLKNCSEFATDNNGKVFLANAGLNQQFEDEPLYFEGKTRAGTGSHWVEMEGKWNTTPNHLRPTTVLVDLEVTGSDVLVRIEQAGYGRVDEAIDAAWADLDNWVFLLGKLKKAAEAK